MSIVRRGIRSLGELRLSGEAEAKNWSCTGGHPEVINVDFYVAMIECV